MFHKLKSTRAVVQWTNVTDFPSFDQTKLPFSVKDTTQKIMRTSTQIIQPFRFRWRKICAVVMIIFFLAACINGENKNQMVRLAKLEIDPAQLEAYKTMLKEEIETSVKVEPGVITLYAVSEKNRPSHITILEIYADSNAYQAHIKTPHFLKYKNGTTNMVKSLELVETIPLVPDMKIK